ncbi:MAG: DNA cytosine methyltransferase [Candidatus Kariarchaeaceae archaeon]
MLSLVDLFSGGGGASAGYHQAGFTTTSAIDNAWHCIETFNLNFPTIATLEDISKLRAENILDRIQSHPLVVSASPPCEPFTTANVRRVKDPYRRLFEDKIGRLMLHAIRLIANLRPQFFIIENVRGILDGNGKELLKEEFARYGITEVYFNYVDAVKWGVPSYRLRVFITNFPLNKPTCKEKTVGEVIGSLEDPRYPHPHEYHTYTPLSLAMQKKVTSLPQGEGLVHFRGSKTDLKNYVRLSSSKPAPVVMGKSRFIHPDEDRLLTPFEHGRLMTFPDNYKYHGTKDQIYDLIGEAIPPLITNEIGKQIQDLLES